MTSAKYNFTIEQGASLTIPLTVADTISGSSVNRDLTGYSARMKIKQLVTDDTAILELTTANGRLVIDPDQTANRGKMSIELTATVTAGLDFDQAVYDLELVNGAIVERLLRGKVKLSKEVTD